MENLTTLIVDNHDLTRKMIRTVVEKLGHNVVEAIDAATAIEKYNESLPDIIILEVNIGNLGGIELCQLIRQRFGNENVVIIFLSGLADERTVIDCLKAGCDNYLRKPFSPAELSARIERYSDKLNYSMYKTRTGQLKWINTTLAGDKDKYKITGKLAQGGMGVIYSGYRVSDKKRIVIKTLKAGVSKSDIQRFLHEVKIAQKMCHRNIVRCMDAIYQDGCVGYVMEYIKGVPIGGKLPQQKALDIVRQIAKSLSYLNSLQLIHRDIKPQNILLTGKGAVLIDLGLVKKFRQAKITTTGIIVGTLEFLSPEQITQVELDIRSDIYSLGLTWYFMLTNNLPFSGGSTDHVLIERIFKKPETIHKYNPNIPTKVWQIIQKMLANPIIERYQTPDELLDDLEQVSLQNEILAFT